MRIKNSLNMFRYTTQATANSTKTKVRTFLFRYSKKKKRHQTWACSSWIPSVTEDGFLIPEILKLIGLTCLNRQKTASLRNTILPVKCYAVSLKFWKNIAANCLINFVGLGCYTLQHLAAVTRSHKILRNIDCGMLN